MSTKFLSPGWRMPRNANQSKQSNYSMDFDGSSQYIDCGESVLHTSNATVFTLSAWIKTSAIGTNQMIIDASTAPNGSGYSMYLRSSGKIRFWSYLANNDINSITTLLPNTWYHICATHDRIGLENKLYINGVLDVSGASGSFNPTPMTNLRIGTSALFGFPFNGNIDEPCFFNRKLIQSEITTLATAPTVDLTSLSPISWYRMGDSVTAFPTIPDAIGTNDGTAYNEPEGTMVVIDVP